MNELKPHAIRIFDDTLESITGADTIQKAQEIRQLAQGYITGLRLLGVFTDRQYNAMDSLLNAAVNAVTHRIKIATSGVTSTESGFVQRNSANTNSIAIFTISVKNGGTNNETVKPNS